MDSILGKLIMDEILTNLFSLIWQVRVMISLRAMKNPKKGSEHQVHN